MLFIKQFLFKESFQKERNTMNSIIYLVGLVVIVLAILSFLGIN